MELKDYLSIIWKNIILLVVIIAVFVIGAYWSTVRKPVEYQSSTAISVAKTKSDNQSNANYYEYDKYYSIQASSDLGDSIIGLFSSPSFVSEVFSKAGYNLPSANLRSLAKSFTAKKQDSTAAVVTVNYNNTNKEKAGKIIETSAQLAKYQIESSFSSASEEFTVSYINPVVIASPKPILINTLIGLFVGLFVALGIVFIKESIKK